jgi:CheY-like chemotaxis protein
MNDVLIVDDNAPLRAILSEILSWVGFKVRAVESGRAAIESYKTKPATLVILDICMPGMDGLETLKLLRVIDPHVKVLGISGFGSDLSALFLTMTGALGADAMLEKPFAKAVLLKAVRKILSPGLYPGRLQAPIGAERCYGGAHRSFPGGHPPVGVKL